MISTTQAGEAGAIALVVGVGLPLAAYRRHLLAA